jgi:nucleoside-diphosphate-sugar epimerase
MRLLEVGWEVDLTGRNPLRFDAAITSMGARYVQSDRHDVDELVRVLGDGADLIVDCVCYTAGDATQLVALAKDAGSTVMVSSKAVYVDTNGKHSNSLGGPDFDAPIRESQRTMDPSHFDVNSAESYGANKVAAELTILESGLPISIVRPSKIHGVGARRPREWFFVKRILDHRPLLLANQGESVESLTSSVNLAELILVLAAKPGSRILNAADPDTPNVKTMASIIASQLHHEWSELLLLPEASSGLGRSPWDTSVPVILDTSAALELGYRPVGDYSSTVREEIDWLADIAFGGNGVRLSADFDNEFFEGLFEYDKEDAFLAARGEFR